MQAEASTSKVPSVPSPPSNIFAQLQSLLTSQSSLIAALPYLHPYAPAPYKGKTKASVYSLQDQLDLLSQLKRSVDDARVVLQSSGAGGKDESKVKLLRALKDVSTHQQVTLPSTTAISTLNPTSSPVLPSKHILLSPVELLRSLASSLDIQFYLEESQFGLLKTSLTLAGTCFVVDLDLETDAVGGTDDDDEMEVDSRSETAAAAAAAVAAPTQDREGKGRVRLSKITGNHVKGEATGKSDWIAKVLRHSLEGYLSIWNEKMHGWDGQMRLEGVIRGLEEEMRCLKELDGLAETAEQQGADGVDWFAELEEVAKKFDSLSEAKTVHRPSKLSIFPSFDLLPTQPGSANQSFRLRPSRKLESIPVPPGLADDIEETWLRGRWVVECLGELGDGMVVRRSWLVDETGNDETNWDGLIRVEHLLYRQMSKLSMTNGIAVPFPYNSDFVHANKQSLDQRWAMAEPGPEGFVVGRIGCPHSFAGLTKLIEHLRRQAVLNQLFSSVFQPSSLDLISDESASTASDDETLDDLLSAPAKATAITAKLLQGSLRLDVAYPSASIDDKAVTGVPSATVTLEVKPVSTPPFVEVACSSLDSLSVEQRSRVEEGLEQAKGAGMDAVEIVRRVIAACA